MPYIVVNGTVRDTDNRVVYHTGKLYADDEVPEHCRGAMVYVGGEVPPKPKVKIKLKESKRNKP